MFKLKLLQVKWLFQSLEEKHFQETELKVMSRIDLEIIHSQV